MQSRRITVLAGGVGAARFLQGTVHVLPPAGITVIGNVGDDLAYCGLHISPDLDTVFYALAGTIDEQRGWGVREDTTRAMDRSRELGFDAWFWLGDLDIGLHLARTAWMQAGATLTQATQNLCKAAGLRVQLLPATDGPVRTLLHTEVGTLTFQEYFVRRGHRDQVNAVEFDGAASAAPAPGVLESLAHADAIVLAPSNPIISIGPILAVAEIRTALERRAVPCVAVSPIIAGAAIKGPAAAMLRSLGHDVSPVGVADMYAGLVDAMVIDTEDAHHAQVIEQRGIAVTVTDTIMRDQASRVALARATLDAVLPAARS